MIQTVYVPVKASERQPNSPSCYFASTNLSDGEFLEYSDKKWYGDLRENETVQVWLEPTEAILLSKEDAEKIRVAVYKQVTRLNKLPESMTVNTVIEDLEAAIEIVKP